MNKNTKDCQKSNDPVSTESKICQQSQKHQKCGKYRKKTIKNQQQIIRTEF